jgi:hypothetical protein
MCLRKSSLLPNKNIPLYIFFIILTKKKECCFESKLTAKTQSTTPFSISAITDKLKLTAKTQFAIPFVISAIADKLKLIAKTQSAIPFFISAIADRRKLTAKIQSAIPFLISAIADKPKFTAKTKSSHPNNISHRQCLCYTIQLFELCNKFLRKLLFYHILQQAQD